MQNVPLRIVFTNSVAYKPNIKSLAVVPPDVR